MKTSKCKGCGADIIWVETAYSKKHPLDAKERQIWVHDGGNSWSIMRGHESHFATCPEASKFRRQPQCPNGSKTNTYSRRIDDKGVTLP